MKNMQKGFATMLLFIIILLVAGGLIYLYAQDPNDPFSFLKSSVAPVACTEDALMCPDGSYIGRTGPKCEFVCPTPSDQQTASIDIIVPSPLTKENNPFIGVSYLKTNFKVTLENGKQISVLVRELKKVYLDMPHNSTTPPDNWVTFYNLVKKRNEEYRGMPLPIKIKGYWIDDNTFEATEISWQIG